MGSEMCIRDSSVSALESELRALTESAEAQSSEQCEWLMESQAALSESATEHTAAVAALSSDHKAVIDAHEAALSAASAEHAAAVSALSSDHEAAMESLRSESALTLRASVEHHEGETARHVSRSTELEEMHDESSAECDRLRSLVEAAEAAMSSQQESTVALEEQVRLLRESAEAQRAEHSSDRAGLIDEHSSAIEHLQATMRSEALDAERERESRHAAMSDEHAAALSNAREEHAEAVSALRSTHEDELRSLASSHAALSTKHEESVVTMRSSQQLSLIHI